MVDIAACSDNGFILAGYTNSFGTAENSGWLVRIDSIGNTLWTQTYGDQGYNYLEAVQETHDGGFVLTGLTGYSGPGDNYDLWLIRTDEYGDTLWTRRHGGANNDSGDEIICANDSTYIIGGNTDSFGSGASDAWLLAVNANGDTLWTRTFGGSRIESLDDLDLTPDNGFVFTGFSSSFGNQTNAAWVVRTDSIGNEIWSSHVSGDHRDRAYAVHPMSDGTYVVVGETASFGAVLSDTWLLKFSDTGDTLWTRIIGGNWYDWASDVVETPDSNIFIVGKTSFFGFPPDAWAAQFDRNGELQSAVIFDIDLFGTFIEVEPHPGGGYVIVGIGDPNADTGPDATALRLVPIDNSPPTQFHLKL
ncbi:MAG: hypothetical protein KAU50_07625, partial [Candidatus Marinimicrobia bacterium]|nr:hypothetical protein [Candidatus Neomarinimicrobiota bacterium]